MFCTSLRKRKEWASVPSTLLSQQLPKWKEQVLESHDLAIPLPQRQQEPKHLFQLLLLSSIDVQPPEKSLDRIERLYQAGGQHVGIIFLLHEKDSQHGGTGAFMNLQAIILSSGFEMPVIPLPSVASLCRTISTFRQQLFQSHTPMAKLNPATALLPFCSNNPPIPEHARHVLSDVILSIPELVQAATTPDGQEWLKEWLTEPSPAVADDIIGFWEQEYIAE